MAKKQTKKWTGPRAMANYVIVAIVISVSFVAFSRWPTGPAEGTSKELLGSVSPTTKPVIRIATYNIHSGVGTDGRFDLARTAKLLSGYDLVGLQEARGYLFDQPQSAEIGSIGSFNSLFSANEWTRFHDNFGNALLTRLPVDQWKRSSMPVTQWSHYRNLLTVYTRIADKPLIVNIVHLDRTVDREKQLKMVLEAFASQSPPCVVMGDFNTRPGDPLLKPFLDVSTDAVGHPEKADRVDWIFTRGLSVIDSGIVESDASDHPLVWAELRLPDEPAKEK